MTRNLLILTGLVAMTSTAAIAQISVSRFPSSPARGGPLDAVTAGYGHEPMTSQPSMRVRFSHQQIEQMVRWGHVGQCVAGKDRQASLSYVSAKRGSTEATAAAKRLNPAFASCLAGSRITRRGNVFYRRAAIADALGVKLST